MPYSILIAGSGAVARDAGTYFLKKGNSVSWVSRSESCLADLQSQVNAEVHAFMMQQRGRVRQMSASFFLYDELENDEFDVIIECTRETLEDKKDVIARLSAQITGAAILATTSQGILPSAIHPSCAGFRLGVPLEHLKSVRLVFPAGMPTSQKEKIIEFFRENGIAFGSNAG
jgi:3-hydroxyacyl-CoA dehydrogenase